MDPTPLDAAVHGMVAESCAFMLAMPLPRQKNSGRMPAPRASGPDVGLARETFLYTAAMVPFLHFGTLLVPTFGLMIAAAMVVAYYVLRADFARRSLAAKESTTAEMFVAVPALCGIVGAKLYHVLETPRELLADPLGQLFSRYGLAWFGGLIAGFAAFVWLARRFKYSLLAVFDAGSAAAAIGYGVGRIGCLLSGDGDYGVPTSLPWGMSFPNGLVPTTERVHPTPIYELIVACLITWILWRMGARQIRAMGEHSSAGGALAPGSVFAAYLILTGVARFLVEFIRINPRSFFGMTNAQAASLASVIAGVALWVAVAGKNLPERHGAHR
jgi:phosphatidylglycerol:prolipoprotein diacylglycerol transferase